MRFFGLLPRPRMSALPSPSAPAIDAPLVDLHAAEDPEQDDADRDGRDMADPGTALFRLRERERLQAILTPHVGTPLFAAACHLAFQTTLNRQAASAVLNAVVLPASEPVRRPWPPARPVALEPNNAA